MRIRSIHAGLTLAGATLLALAVSSPASAGTQPVHVFSGTPSTLSAAQVAQLSADANQRSIIVFKNQLASLPASGSTMNSRVSAANNAQAGIMSELSQLQAKNVRGFHIVNAISATISAAEVSRLQANAAVSEVVPDVERSFASLGSAGAASAGAASSASASAGSGKAAPSSATQQVCPSNPAQPLIEPEARQVMNVDAAEQIVDGSGIKVGIIADGIDPNNPDLIRANNQHVIFDYEDFSGFGLGAPTDGREAFLDAGTIASQGNQTYDLSGFVNPAHPLPAGCTIKSKGTG